jgi:hypothetical protein
MSKSFIKFAIFAILLFAFIGYISADATNPDLQPQIAGGVSEVKSN